MLSNATRGRQYTSLIIFTYISAVISMSLFQVKVIDMNGQKLIATSNYNYAIASPRLSAKGWLAVSVNGDSVLLITSANEKVLTTKTALGADLAFIESIRDEISEGHSGFSHMSSMSGGNLGGSSYMMSSSGGGGTSFSSSSGGGFSSGGLSVNMRDNDNFSISRSNLPFSWSQVFFNGNFVTFVYRNGDVKMLTITALDGPELEAAETLRKEAREAPNRTMRTSMDMVSSIFNGIMGRLPKPPDFGSSVGSMFGNNFPFGPNNSPFGGSFPFGGGTGAFAVAGRRR